jgi:thiol-disulfide isomerase/thioredoxin
MKRLIATIAVAACSFAGPGSGAQAASGPPSANVAWLPAAADADIERAFAQARSARKPVLLYWGASWCPPCNQLKATLFNRQDFASLSRSFVAVHVDGDLPGAQKLGRRFQVSGYPTLVLFSADGIEITRLPGQVDAPQVLAVLQLGLAGGRPVKAVLADALAGRPLAASDWKLLAFYSWETDEQQLVPATELPATLERLAAASQGDDAETTTRLWLQALAAGEEGKGLQPDAALRERLQRVLADPVQSRAQMDVLTSGAADIVRRFGAGPGPLVAAYDAALRRLQADATLSRADRLGALEARVELARLAWPKDAVRVALPAPLRAELRQQVARDEREISDGYERQAVITEAAGTLARAGLWAESDALLRGNLARSHSPYFLMSQLGANARKQGREAEALRWYRQAFEQSVGPATRLQWGAAYLAALLDLAPRDGKRIEQTAARIIDETALDSGAFEGRSLRSLQRMSRKLAGWNADGRGAATLRKLQARLDGVCARVELAEDRRAVCKALLESGANKPA